MKLHHKLTTWLMAVGGLAHVGAQLPPIVDLNSGSGAATATQRTTANLANPNADFSVTPPAQPGPPPNWTVNPAGKVESHWIHPAEPANPQQSALFKDEAGSNPANFPSLSRQVNGVYDSDGSTLTVSFGVVWRGMSAGTRTLTVSLGGTDYATITTPTTFTPESAATFTPINGASGAITPILIGNNELNRGVTNVSFTLANPSNGLLKFTAGTGDDLFVIDNVSVVGNHANLIENGSFADSPAANKWTLAGVGTVGGSGAGSPFYTVAGGAGASGASVATLTSDAVPFPSGIESASLAASFKIAWTYPVVPSNDHRTLVLSYKGKDYLTIGRDLNFTTHNGAAVSPTSLDLSGTPTTVTVTLPELAVPWDGANSLKFDISGGVSNPGADSIVIDDIVLKGTWKSNVNGYNYGPVTPGFSAYSTNGVKIADTGRDLRGGLLGVSELTASIPVVAGDSLGVLKGGVFTTDLSVGNLGANYWPTGITVQSSNASNITLTGAATREQYEDALDLIRFKSNRSNGATVAVTVTTKDLTPVANANVAQALIKLDTINNPPTTINPAVDPRTPIDFGPELTIQLNTFFTNDGMGDPYLYGFSTAAGANNVNGAQIVDRRSPLAYDDTTSNAAGDNGNKLQITAFNSATGELKVRAGRRASQNTATGFAKGKFQLIVGVKEGNANGAWQATKTIEFTVSNQVPLASDNPIEFHDAPSHTTTTVIAAPVSPATELTLINATTDPDGDGGATYPKGLSIVAGQTNRQGTPDELSYLPGGPGKGYFTVNPTTGAVTFNPNGEFDYLPAGSYQFTYYDVEIQDADGGIGHKRVRVHVEGVDDAPYLVGAFPATITSNQGATITGQALLGNAGPGLVQLSNPITAYFADDDGAYNLSVDVSTLPPGVSFTAGNTSTPGVGAFTGAIPPATAGSYTVEITAQDISNPSLVRTVYLEWKVVNPAPTLAVTTFSGPEDMTLVGTLNGSADDDSTFGVNAAYGNTGPPNNTDFLAIPGKPAFKIVTPTTKGTIKLNSVHTATLGAPASDQHTQINGLSNTPPRYDLKTVGFTYVPNLNTNGADSFVVEVTDADGATNTITVTLNITPVDDSPFLVSNPPAQTNKDGETVDFDISGFFDDVDTPLAQRTYGSYNNVLPPGLTLDINTGKITGRLTAAASSGSPYTVQLRAFDQSSASTGIANFQWTVNNVAPDPKPDIYSVTVPAAIWGTSQTVGNIVAGTATAPFTVPNANGKDLDGAPENGTAPYTDVIKAVAGSHTIPASPAHYLSGLKFSWTTTGALTLDIGPGQSSAASLNNLRNLAAGQLVTTPNIPYTATDADPNNGGTNNTTASYFTVTFTGVNNVPLTSADPAKTVALGSFTYHDGDNIRQTTGGLLALDFRTHLIDHDNANAPAGVTGAGDTATWTVTSSPALPSGTTLSIGTNGLLEGTLGANVSGGTTKAYAITVKRRDGANPPQAEVDVVSATFNLTVNNKAPDARDDSFTIASETGTASGNVITGSPAAGKDTDGSPLTETAAPRPTGEKDSDALVVTHLIRTTPVVSVAVPVNNNEVEVPGTWSSQSKGKFFIKRDGSVRFETGNDFLDLKSGQSRFVTASYTISDGNLSDTATITVEVKGTNNAPVIAVAPVKIEASTLANPKPNQQVKLNAADMDANTPLSFTLLDTTDNGILQQFTNQIINNGANGGSVEHTITYTPNTNYVGPDSFTYTVLDDSSPTALADTQTIPIEVWYQNQDPVRVSATLPNQTGGEGKPFSLAGSVISSNFSDPDEVYTPPYNDVLTYTAVITAQTPAANAPNSTPLHYPNFIGTQLIPDNAFGLVMDPATGAITGTINTQAGADPSRSYTITVTATDMGNRFNTPVNGFKTATATFVLNVQLTDTDGDGVRDADDMDADNDGIPDDTEKAYARNNGDTDGDGIPDHLDVDSDNDGIYDAVESGSFANVDWITGRLTGAVGKDGIPNTVQNNPDTGDVKYSLADTDQDGWADYVDLDSDNDGISDLLESGYATLVDANHDGLADAPVSANGAPLTVGKTNPANTDGDTYTFGPYIGQPLADFRDLDSNNDGIKDITANGYAALDLNGDGIIDDFADIDQDGIADVIDTIKPGFGGFPVAGYAQWLAQAGNGTDTDGDVFPLTQEYALGGSPTSGLHKVVGTAHTQGLVLSISGSTVNGSFVRPAGRFDVTYTLAVSTNLTAWTNVATAPVVTANGDGTDTLAWTNLQTAGDTGYARLRVVVGGNTSYTLPQGWSKTTVLGDTQSYSSPLLNTPVLTGVVTFSSAEGLQSSTPIGTLTPAGSYYVEFTDGPAEGHRFTLDSASGVNLGIALSSPLNTRDAGIPGNLAGSHFVVRKYNTLGEVFASVVGGSSQGTSDNVLIWTGAGWTQKYWKRQSDGFWILIGQGLANRADTILAPGTGVLFTKSNPGAPKVLWQVGEVRYNDFRYSLDAGDTFLATGFPLSETPNGLGLTNANGLPFTQTQIHLWDGDITPGTAGFVNNNSILRPQGWRRTSDNANTGDSPLFQAFRAGFLRIINPLDLTHAQPVTDNLWTQP